ncbi:MAG: zinc-ribbon domain-containing protein [Chloroflexota bacterium]|nr:zinc-ribbon domain-containing protein [Chloroflexota bacterium]
MNSNLDDNPVGRLGQQLRKSLDRMGFEADKLMRANRVRSEATRIKNQAESLTLKLGEQALVLAAGGSTLDPTLQSLVDEVQALQKEAEAKEREIRQIGDETWTPPLSPPPFQLPGSTSASAALPREAASASMPLTPPPAASQQVAHTSEATHEAATHVTGGEARNTTCPVCGMSTRQGATFCAHCGYKLAN